MGGQNGCVLHLLLLAPILLLACMVRETTSHAVLSSAPSSSARPALSTSTATAAECNTTLALGFYTLRCDAQGNIVSPWSSIAAAMAAEVEWYMNAPPGAHGFPTYVYSTFVDGNRSIIFPNGEQLIAAMQHGMGIIGYLKYWDWQGRQDARVLARARLLADYLVSNALTLANPSFAYPSFPRSSGLGFDFPMVTAAQADVQFGMNTIEPDKGGIAGWALVQLYNATQDKTYLDVAVNVAATLARNMLPGSTINAPWPFRVDAETGEPLDGRKNGNMAYILRLFRSLVRLGHKDFAAPAESLWHWILAVQLPSLQVCQNATLCHFVNFFEDHEAGADLNRNSWSALELARLLVEEKAALDRNWLQHALDLFAFAVDALGQASVGNTTLVGEQDEDRNAWGGANSRLGSLAALLACAGGPSYMAQLGQNNMAWMTYFVDTDGCSSPNAYDVGIPVPRGGWQEDAHTDVLHSIVDGLRAQQGHC